MMQSRLEDRVAASLRHANLRFAREAPFQGLRADFLVATRTGPVILEVKESLHGHLEVERALELARRFGESTGAKAAIVVGPDEAAVESNGRVFSSSGLISRLRELGAEPWFNKLSGSSSPDEASVSTFFTIQSMTDSISRKPKPEEQTAHQLTSAAAVKQNGPRSQLFVALPFSAEFDDVYFVAAKQAALKRGLYALKIGEEYFSGETASRIRKELERSVAVIADVSGANPNVLYEVGFAHALTKPMVQISRTPLAELPFDIRGWNTIHYSAGQTHALAKTLDSALKNLSL
jgi:hypothetical protein